MFILEPHIAEMVVHKTIIKLFHFDLHSEHKSCLLSSLEWNMKGCKTSTHAYTHIQKFVLADYAGFFKCQMSKESLIILSNVPCFHKIETNMNNFQTTIFTFKMFCGFSA